MKFEDDSVHFKVLNQKCLLCSKYFEGFPLCGLNILFISFLCFRSRNQNEWKPFTTVWLITRTSWPSLKARWSWWTERRTRSGGSVSQSLICTTRSQPTPAQSVVQDVFAGALCHHSSTQQKNLWAHCDRRQCRRLFFRRPLLPVRTQTSCNWFPLRPFLHTWPYLVSIPSWTHSSPKYPQSFLPSPLPLWKRTTLLSRSAYDVNLFPC